MSVLSQAGEPGVLLRNPPCYLPSCAIISHMGITAKAIRRLTAIAKTATTSHVEMILLSILIFASSCDFTANHPALSRRTDQKGDFTTRLAREGLNQPDLAEFRREIDQALSWAIPIAVDHYAILEGKAPHSLEQVAVEGYTPIGLGFEFKVGNPNLMLCSRNGITVEYDPKGKQIRTLDWGMDNLADWTPLRLPDTRAIHLADVAGNTYSSVEFTHSLKKSESKALLLASMLEYVLNNCGVRWEILNSTEQEFWLQHVWLELGLTWMPDPITGKELKYSVEQKPKELCRFQISYHERQENDSLAPQIWLIPLDAEGQNILSRLEPWEGKASD